MGINRFGNLFGFLNTLLSVGYRFLNGDMGVISSACSIETL